MQDMAPFRASEQNIRALSEYLERPTTPPLAPVDLPGAAAGLTMNIMGQAIDPKKVYVEVGGTPRPFPSQHAEILRHHT